MDVDACSEENPEWFCWYLIPAGAYSGLYYLNRVLGGDDDYMGMAVDADVWNSETGDAVLRTHAIVRGQTRTGEANIHQRNYATPPPPPLSATMSGPSRISQKGTYTWEANPSGGSGSYTYQWYAQYFDLAMTYTLGTQKTQSRTVYADDGDFEMRVVVTSAGSNETVTVKRYVTNCIASDSCLTY